MSERKSIMRSLGEFFGHIAQGIRTDPTCPEAGPDSTVVREETEERGGRTPDGRKMILRRTIIEEVEVDPAAPVDPENPGNAG